MNLTHAGSNSREKSKNLNTLVNFFNNLDEGRVYEEGFTYQTTSDIQVFDYKKRYVFIIKEFYYKAKEKYFFLLEIIKNGKFFRTEMFEKFEDLYDGIKAFISEIDNQDKINEEGVYFYHNYLLGIIKETLSSIVEENGFEKVEMSATSLPKNDKGNTILYRLLLKDGDELEITEEPDDSFLLCIRNKNKELITGSYCNGNKIVKILKKILETYITLRS